MKERRQALSITQEYLADRLDVNPSHISNIECGRANPSLTALVNIANLLECSVDCFIGGEYTYKARKAQEENIDDKILEKLEYCNIETKNKLLKIMDILFD